MHEAGLRNIYLIAPTTPDERIELIVKRATGFIYYVSREGVTGMQQKVSDTIGMMTAKIRQHTNLPIAVGFGISRPAMVAEACRYADAAVVGSALVQEIATHAGASDLASRVESYVAWLKSDL